WSTHGTEHDGAGHRSSLLRSWPPESAQPNRTIGEQLRDTGIDFRVVAPVEFAGTGLTRAALRGGQPCGVRAFGDLAAGVLDAAGADVPTLSYAYHGHLDLLGHVHGPGSPPWRLQLNQLDHLVATVVERLPAGALLTVVADHGMVSFDPGQAL